MAFRLLLLFALILLLQGCGDDFVSPSRPPTGQPPTAGLVFGLPASPPEEIQECAPDDDAWLQIMKLYETTETSIHELITCGRVQVTLSKSLLAIVLASNKELFRGDAFETLASYARYAGLELRAPFSRAEEGRWSMPIVGASAGSRFWVQFFAPGSEEPILADPFDLESYLVNPRIEAIYSLGEMLADLELRNHFIFYYDREGPLAGLLNEGQSLPNPFVVTVSIADVAGLVLPGFDSDPDGAFFGALESLTQAEMISCVEFFDDRLGARVEYRADGERDTVGRIAGSGQVGFVVDEISSSDGSYELEGEASRLRYVGDKSLAGTITYEVIGAKGLTIESDFRSGRAWPIASVMCVDPALP